MSKVIVIAVCVWLFYLFLTSPGGVEKPANLIDWQPRSLCRLEEDRSSQDHDEGEVAVDVYAKAGSGLTTSWGGVYVIHYQGCKRWVFTRCLAPPTGKGMYLRLRVRTLLRSEGVDIVLISEVDRAYLNPQNIENEVQQPSIYNSTAKTNLHKH